MRIAACVLLLAVTGDADIYPPVEVRARLFSEQLQALPAQRDRTRLWTAFRTHY